MADSKAPRTRRSFAEDYKAGAVRLVLDEGKTVAGAARDLGLTESSLGIEPSEKALRPSYGKTIRPNRPTTYEQVRVESRDGAIFYVPVVDEQGPIPFALARSGDQEVAFENPTHDYPQRIVYSRKGDALNAKLELLDAAKPRTQTFAYTRVSCD